jgi:hypothetical protein
MVHSGQLVYQTTVQRDTTTMATGWRTITVSETAYGGAAGWLLLETRVAIGPATTDSLVVTRSDFRPMHWGSSQGEARVSVEFAGDSLFGAVSAPSARRSVVSAAPSGLLVNQAMLEVALQALPLQLGWRDSTASVSLTIGGAAIIPTNLVVSAEESIRVPAGSFDCLVVGASAGEARATYWVAKREHIVVQSVQTIATMGDARVVGQLIRLTP